jgi:ABC-2 type transport system permease protein
VLEFFVAELRRNWTVLWRYPLQAVSGMVMTLILFLALLSGIRYVAGPAQAFGDRMDALVVGYVLWNTLVVAMGEIAGGLQSEGKIGTLEQLFLSPLRGTTVFLLRALAGQTVVLSVNALILGLLLLVTGVRLHFAAALVLPLLTALAACYGLGLALGSMALVFKRVEALVQMAQFALIGLVIVPFESWSAGPANPLFLLPLTPSAAAIRQLMARGEPLGVPLLLTALVNGAVYLALGALAFEWAERTTKRQGLLGTY